MRHPDLDGAQTLRRGNAVLSDPVEGSDDQDLPSRTAPADLLLANVAHLGGIAAPGLFASGARSSAVT